MSHQRIHQPLMYALCTLAQDAHSALDLFMTLVDGGERLCARRKKNGWACEYGCICTKCTRQLWHLLNICDLRLSECQPTENDTTTHTHTHSYSHTVTQTIDSFALMSVHLALLAYWYTLRTRDCVQLPVHTQHTPTHSLCALCHLHHRTAMQL